MTPYYDHAGVTLYDGDCRNALLELPDESVNTITSPPYWGLRDYGVDGQIGLEETLERFIDELIGVFRLARRVLRNDGTLWLNLGDTYIGGRTGGVGSSSTLNGRNHQAVVDAAAKFPAKTKRVDGLKYKDLVGLPWRVAFALQADGWWLRSEVIWEKPATMPESVTDRPTRSHEQVFLLAKAAEYYYDAIKEPASGTSHHRGAAGVGPKATSADGRTVRYNGSYAHAIRGVVDRRNKRTVWRVAPEPYHGAHFATFPSKLIEPMILAGCPAGGVVLDPFAGAGTTLAVAKNLGRRSIGIEINTNYCALAVDRLRQDVLPLMEAPR